jgi:hypothetical protein
MDEDKAEQTLCRTVEQKQRGIFECPASHSVKLSGKMPRTCES